MPMFSDADESVPTQINRSNQLYFQTFLRRIELITE